MGTWCSMGDGAQGTKDRLGAQLLAPAAGEYLGGGVDRSHD